VRRSLFFFSFFFFFREEKTFCLVVVVAKNWIANRNRHHLLAKSLSLHPRARKKQIVQKNESEERDLLTISGGEYK
jgi:hypothetical protein